MDGENIKRNLLDSPSILSSLNSPIWTYSTMLPICKWQTWFHLANLGSTSLKSPTRTTTIPHPCYSIQLAFSPSFSDILATYVMLVNCIKIQSDNDHGSMSHASLLMYLLMNFYVLLSHKQLSAFKVFLATTLLVLPEANEVFPKL